MLGHVDLAPQPREVQLHLGPDLVEVHRPALQVGGLLLHVLHGDRGLGDPPRDGAQLRRGEAVQVVGPGPELLLDPGDHAPRLLLRPARLGQRLGRGVAGLGGVLGDVAVPLQLRLQDRDLLPVLVEVKPVLVQAELHCVQLQDHVVCILPQSLSFLTQILGDEPQILSFLPQIVVSRRIGHLVGLYSSVKSSEGSLPGLVKTVNNLLVSIGRLDGEVSIDSDLVIEHVLDLLRDLVELDGVGLAGEDVAGPVVLHHGGHPDLALLQQLRLRPQLLELLYDLLEEIPGALEQLVTVFDQLLAVVDPLIVLGDNVLDPLALVERVTE